MGDDHLVIDLWFESFSSTNQHCHGIILNNENYYEYRTNIFVAYLYKKAHAEDSFNICNGFEFQFLTRES